MSAFNLSEPGQSPKGVATLLKTPFLPDHRLDELSFRRQTRHVVEVGTCMGIVGMVGSETYTLPDAERVRCIEIALEICHPRVPVCVAVVGASVPDVVAAARRAEGMGADLIAVVPPAWSKDEADLETCNLAIAKAVQRPVMVHSLGGRGVTYSVDGLVQLPAKSSRVLYLKEEAEFAARRVGAVLDRPGGRGYRRIMVGPPLVLGYLAGARLFMAAADLIEAFIAVFDALERGDVAEARRVDALIHAVTFFKRYIQGEFSNKMIMQRRGIFGSARLGVPSASGGLSDLTPAEEDELTELLRPLLPLFRAHPPKPPA